MSRWSWVLGSIVGASVLGNTPEARATCSWECQMVPVYSDCTEAPLNDDETAYEWEQLDQLRALASCTETCCAPGSCSDPVEVDPAVVPFQLHDESGTLPVLFQIFDQCEGSVAVATVDLVPGERYTVTVEGELMFRADVIEPASEDGSSGDSGGDSGGDSSTDAGTDSGGDSGTDAGADSGGSDGTGSGGSAGSGGDTGGESGDDAGGGTDSTAGENDGMGSGGGCRIGGEGPTGSLLGLMLLGLAGARRRRRPANG